MNYEFNTEKKDASKYVIEKNKEVLTKFNFADKEDFDFATRGLVAEFDKDMIYNEDGTRAFDLKRFEFLNEYDPENAPSTVNPSLWRQGVLNNYNGVFKVNENVYQVRGTDTANMTAIRGKSGWILIDVMTSMATAKASFEFLKKTVEDMPIKAIIYTHSHADHFGGVRGLITDEQVKNGEVAVIAPENFTYESGSEMVIAGNAMKRRTTFQYAAGVEASPRGTVGVGLCNELTTGIVSLIAPSTELPCEEEVHLDVDGVKFIFSEASETEAVSEFVMYMPEYKTYCSAEITNRTQHNLLTPRGAQIRSSLKWGKVIDRTLRLFGNDMDYMVGTHHWPVFGNEKCKEFLENSRDLYLFLHNETVRKFNNGVTIKELPFEVQLSDELLSVWYTHGYYGALEHNVKAIYQYYLGFYDGNPSTYLELPSAESGKLFAEMMGGVDNTLNKCAEFLERGEFLWVAEVLNKIVFAYPENRNAQLMLADTLEQIAYTEESGARRNCYVKAVDELRKGKPEDSGIKIGEEMLVGLSPEQILDFLGTKYNYKIAKGSINIKFVFEDLNETRMLTSTKNGVLFNYVENEDAKLTISASKINMVSLLMGLGAEKLIESGKIKLLGDKSQLEILLTSLENSNPNFAIVTP